MIEIVVATAIVTGIRIGIALHEFCLDRCIVLLILCSIVFYVVLVTQNIYGRKTAVFKWQPMRLQEN